MKTKTIFAGLVLVAGLSGCRIFPEPQADTTRYYTLAVAAPDAAVGKGSLRVGLRPVELTAYLKKGVMVVRRGGNEISYRDDARWAEPLEQSLTRALRAHLLGSPKVKSATVAPFPFDQERDLDLAVTVVQCEGVKTGGGGAARFAATVELVRPGAEAAVIARRRIQVPDAAWDGADFAALAQALSAAAGQFAIEVEALLP